MFIIRLPINILQMFIRIHHMSKSILNVEIYPVNQRPLMNDQLVQLPIYCGKVVY